MQVTIFKSLFDKKPYYTDEQTVFKRIKEGGSTKEIIQQLRNTTDQKEKDELKKTLGVILFSGKFSERKLSGLIEYSHLICMDYDKVDVEDYKKRLSAFPWAYAVFTSPSGDGVKCVVKVSSNAHTAHFKALCNELEGADISTKDLSRACFGSYDPDIYINPHPEVYTKIVETTYTDEERYDKLKKWLENKGEQFVSGNRNNFVAKLASAASRFGIEIDFTLKAIQKDYVAGSDFSAREAEGVIRNVYTNYSDQFGTASFDEGVDEKKLTYDIMSVEISAKDIILVEDVMDDMMKDFDEGTPMGNTTFFPILDNHFRFLKGEITTLTGVSTSGKTTILVQLLLFRAAFANEKFALLSMEQFPPVYFYKELVKALIGKPVEYGVPGRMTRREYELGLEWVNQHFFFIYPEKDDPNPDWTLARFYEAIVKHSVDGVVVDPFNSQSHDFKSAGGRDDKYIASMLNKSQRFALQNNVYYFTVAHPRGIGKDQAGYYKEPTADEISGGVSWLQRSDNVLIYHRPSLPIDYQDPSCTLRSSKIKKQSVCGKPGVTNLMYDWRNGRYTENGFNPLDSFTL